MAQGRRPGPIGLHDAHGEPTYRYGGSGHPYAGVSHVGPLGTTSPSLTWHPPPISAVRGRPRRQSIGPISKAPPTPAQPLDYEALYQDVERWEGVVRYMYLDTAKPPRVTVGTGNMLPDIAAAQALPFMNTATKKAATKEEIATAFNKVAAMKGGQKATHYKLHPSIEITEDKAKEMALDRLENEFVPALQHHFKGFDKYPLPARRALVDMVYNMGIGQEARVVKGKTHPATGLSSFGSLKRAVEAGDWQAAALHCHRRNPDNNKHTAERNEWTKDLFEQAERLAHPAQVGAPPVSQH